MFPSEALVREMAVLRGATVDWLGKVKLFNDDARPHVEVLLDNFYQLIRRAIGCTVGFDEE